MSETPTLLRKNDFQDWLYRLLHRELRGTGIRVQLSYYGDGMGSPGLLTLQQEDPQSVRYGIREMRLQIPTTTFSRSGPFPQTGLESEDFDAESAPLGAP